MEKVFTMTETEKRFINNDLWKIFYIQLDRDGNETSNKGIYHKQYKRKADAVRIAKQRYTEPLWKYIVSKENPFI